MAIGTSQAFRTQNLRLLGNLFDKNNFLGKKGYYLSSDEDGTRWIADPNETSGVFSGGILSATVGGTTFNVSAGVGQVVSRTVLPSGEVETTTNRITWNAQSNVSLTYRTTSKFSYIYIDENGTLQQQSNTFTDSQYRNQIVLGVICHINLSTINLVTNKQNVVYGDSHRLYELMSTFGPIKRSGLSVSPYGTDLRISRDSGTVLLIGSNYTTYQFEPDSPTINAVNPASICRVYRNGSGDFVFDTNSGSYYTGIDPTKYDDNSGTLQTVNNNQWTVQRLFFFPSNPNDIIVYYGFGVYNSLNDAFLAIENESFYEAQITAENAVFLGYILLRGGATNLSLITDARFIQSGVSRNVIVGGGGAAGLVLDDLLDVQITNPSDSQFFVYENSSGLWKNATFNAVNPLIFSGVGTSVSLSLNYATASQPGGVSTSAQTFGGAKTFANDVIISGNLTVNGTTTTVDTQTLLVEDKNIELGVVATPTNITADGGGITLKGTTDKTFNWINATSSWTSSENLDLANTKTYKINGTDVLSSTTLGSGVINSSLTSVGTLNNLTVAGYTHLATTSGSVGIGTTSPAYKLDVNGITRFRDIVRFKNNFWNLSDDGNFRFFFGNNGRTYFGSQDGYEFRNSSDSSLMVLNNAGNLGVGIGNPSQLLHISSTGTAKLKITADTDNVDENDLGGIEISQDGGITTSYFGHDNTNSLILGVNSTTAPNIYIGTRTDGTNFVTSADAKVTILNGGNVGIGTTVPLATLDVRSQAMIGDATIAGVAYQTLSVGGHTRIHGTYRLQFGSANGGYASMGITGTATGTITFNTWNGSADKERLRIVNTNGYIGVGTTNPSTLLQLNGDTASHQIFSINRANSITPAIYIGNDSNDNALIASNNTILRFGKDFIGTFNEYVRIDTNGNIGIGTTTVNNRLEVVGNTFNRATFKAISNVQTGIQIVRTGGVSNTDWEIYAPVSSTDLRFYNGSDLVTFKTNGNVGIGNITPNNKLSILGSTSIGSNYNVAAPTNGLLVEGSVGIGTTTTTSKVTLDTVANAGIDIFRSDVNANFTAIRFRNSANSATNAALGFNSNELRIEGTSTINFVTNSVDNRLYISSNGNIGIGGITTPLSLLDVRSGYITSGTASSTSGSTLITGYYTSGYLTSLGTEFSSGGPMLGYAVSPSTSSTGAFLSSTGITIPRSAYVQDGGTHRWYIGPSQNVAVGNAVSASEVMRININGNVGIGTTNPLTRLSVGSGSLADGNIPIQTSSLGNGTERWIGVNKNGAYGLILGYYEGSSLSGLGAYVRQVTSDPLYFVVNNATTAMTMLSSGSVGIGTTNPSTKLEVIGTVKATLFDGPVNQVNITSDDATNSSHYLYFGATNSGASIVKASTKIRFNPSTGAFSSTTKSFRIPHLTKSGYDLVYGSLESPYHGIRLTGKGKTNGNRAEVILPDYINILVDKETVHIQLTPIKCAKILYVDDLFIDDNKFTVKYDKSWFEKAKDVEFYWDFTAERKDVPKLIVEEKQ